MDYQRVCGRRFTAERGMKIHRTKMGCLNASTNQQQRTAQAGRTSENQSHVENHSAEDIYAGESDEEFRQLINAKRQKINFPPASAKEQWEALDSKIVLQLDKLIGKSTLEHKLTTFGDIIYQTCLNTFGAKQHQAKREPKKRRRQREMETLQKQKKNLRKQMKSATEEEKNGLQELWRGLKARHSALSREELARKRRSQKKRTRNASTKTHFSLQDNSSSNQDQVLFQYRKNSWRPT